ncbi:major facilitator superfamily domain-containing protein [Lophiotrema nucula]|uniref:Major facilitator superfamily domain-containing protein n=1 Tax=Lophiotrema nucula TaxID=690887 RepID=A0A6A5ZB18_9PLEO|nr:major facilitator superfamily domain-containing protein [Lophiotrema nucula]
MSTGLALTAGFGNNLGRLICFQGLVYGVGAGIVMSTLTPILPEYYTRRSGVAQGAAAAAAGLGGAVYSLSIRHMLYSLGPRKTLGILASTHFAINTTLSVIAKRPRKFEKRSIYVAKFANFREPKVSLMMLINFISSLAVMIPMCFGPEISNTMGFQGSAPSMILAGMSVLGVPSRLLVGVLADKMGHLNTFIAGTMAYTLSA